VRDPVLDEALRRLAAEAATRFRSLIDTGEEIPFDVVEEPGEHTLYRYKPLTSRFVSGHVAELRSLPSFGPACAAVASAEIAAPYLEARGELVPADPDERAASMLVAFLCSLWEDTAEFSLERNRLERAFRELEAEAAGAAEADSILVPLVGLQMPVARLELAGARIVRADTIEAPPDALRSEGMRRSSWEPQFLAVADVGDGPEGTAAALRSLHELLTLLRLFKEGGVGLGPHAFAPIGAGKWRRISTGAAAPRLAGYKLVEAETGELRDFAHSVAGRPYPRGALAWAIARFEMACERPTATEALSDHLLSLRALFDGKGPLGAGPPVRVAALCAEPVDREDAKRRVERAFALERRVMDGEVVESSSEEGEGALGTATWVEEALRSILRDAVRGDLGTSVSDAADEALVASGLEAGEGSAGQMGSTAEWEGPAPDDEPSSEEIRIHARDETGDDEHGDDEAGDDEHGDGKHGDGEEADSGADASAEEDRAEEDRDEGESQETQVIEADSGDWLSEVSRDARETLEWPAGAGRTERDRVDTPRVRHLFPVPDDTDWNVGELEYSRDKASI
jgi:hypothetical protein